jgi:hypothetical protein
MPYRTGKNLIILVSLVILPTQALYPVSMVRAITFLEWLNSLIYVGFLFHCSTLTLVLLYPYDRKSCFDLAIVCTDKVGSEKKEIVFCLSNRY